MYADENVIRIKHDVLYEVAKLAFAGELEEKKDYIANQKKSHCHLPGIVLFVTC